MKRRELLVGFSSLSLIPASFLKYDSCRGDNIVAAVSESNIDNMYEPWRGDCWHIAVALHDAYNVKIRGFYHPINTEYPSHVFVESDGSYYDGYGRLNPSEFYNEWPDTIREVVDLSREYIVTEVPYYSEQSREDIYDLIVETSAYSTWSGC